MMQLRRSKPETDEAAAATARRVGGGRTALAAGQQQQQRRSLLFSSSSSSSSSRWSFSLVFRILALGVPILALGILFYANASIMTSAIEEHNNQQGRNQGGGGVGDAASSSSSSSNSEPARKMTDNNNNNNNNNDQVDYQLVFSTGCSLYQDWQSYMFFYAAVLAKQPGTITRIASGCNPQEQETMQAIFDKQIAPMAAEPGRFRIHFTPDFSRVAKTHDNRPYVYFNKPFGTRHWLEHAMGFPDHPVNEDAIVILMDPDQFILRPFRNNDFSNTEWRFLKPDETPRTKIEHGKPMGQLYGFAMQWKDKINMTRVLLQAGLVNETTAATAISPVDRMERSDAQRGYIVGPPYIATARDMHSIAVKWTEFGPGVYDQYPYLLAEMFAYCLAAAHLQLQHQTATSFMISDVSARKGEGWSYIDRIPKEEACTYAPPYGEKPNHQLQHTVEDYPNVLHFCQRYGIDQYFWGKRRLPKNVLSCEHPLLAEPPADIATKTTQAIFPNNEIKHWGSQSVRFAFMTCHLIRIANAAITYYKDHHCDPGQANYQKTASMAQDATHVHTET